MNEGFHAFVKLLEFNELGFEGFDHVICVDELLFVFSEGVGELDILFFIFVTEEFDMCDLCF